MSTLNVAVADEKKNMQSLLKGMEFLGTARSSDEAYNMINGNAFPPDTEGQTPL